MNQPASANVPSHSPNVIWRVMDDGAVLVSPEIGKVRVLNEIGSVIWQFIDGQKNLESIALLLVNRYDVSLEQVWRDLSTFVMDLSERGLLVWIS